MIPDWIPQWILVFPKLPKMGGNQYLRLFVYCSTVQLFNRPEAVAELTCLIRQITSIVVLEMENLGLEFTHLREFAGG